MEALGSTGDIHFEIVGAVPQWFLRESLTVSWSLYPLEVDMGLVQVSPLVVDFDASLARLRSFYQKKEAVTDKLTAIFSQCCLVLCDIVPLGFAAADAAGTPSVLIENFTWDWMYEEYLEAQPAFASIIEEIRVLYGLKNFHIQAEPVCSIRQCDCKTPPISRAIRATTAQIRQRLRVKNEDTLVLLTMGGLGGKCFHLEQLQKISGLHFILPGETDTFLCEGNLRLLPADSGMYHPDLVAACDAVVGKIGYSTLAEVYQARLPFGYIGRDDFKESAPLADFILKKMEGMDLTDAFTRGEWLDLLPELVSMKKKGEQRENGAHVAARFLANLLQEGVR